MTGAERAHLERILDKLGNPVSKTRWRSNGVTTLCPGHEDRHTPNLDIDVKGGKIVYICRAGCPQDTVTAALRTRGITRDDLDINAASWNNGPVRRGPRLTLEDFATAKGLPADFLAEHGVVQDGRGLQITYCREDGTLATRQRRRSAVAAKDGSSWDGPRGESPVAYGLWRVEEALELGELLLVEGETDTLTAWHHNVPALGIPGADMVKVLTDDLLRKLQPITLWIVQEPDRGGETFVAGVTKRLEEFAWSGKALVITLPGVKDLNELHRAAGDVFAEQLAKAKAAAVPVGRGDHAHTNQEKPLTVLTWSEMVAEPVKPIEYHWPGWVPRATVTLLAGAGESLKSWLALTLAIATAAGRPVFAGESAEAERLEPGPVLYLTGENSIEEEKRRCTLLKAGLQLHDDLPITFVAAGNLSLGDDADYTAVVGLVERLHPVAIFIDSAIALSGIVQENDNAQVRAFMKTRVLPFSRRHGLTAYLIQHSPKPPTQPGARFTDEHVARGASDWRNAADVVLYLRRDSTLGLQAIVLRHAKQRIGPRHAPIWFSLEDIVPGQAVRIAYGGTYSEEAGLGSAAGLIKALAAAIESLKGSPGGVYASSLEQQLTGSGISKATARRALDVVRGKKPWPHDRLRGQKHAIVTEEKHGRSVFLTFDISQAPIEETEDDG